MAVTAQRVLLVRIETLQSTYLHPVAAALITCLALLTGSSAHADTGPGQVRIVRIDGTTIEGTWNGSVSGAQIEIRSPTGTTSLPLDGLASIDFDNPLEPPLGHTVFFFTDASRLTGRLVADSTLDSATPNDDHLTGQTILGDSTDFTFQQLGTSSS